MKTFALTCIALGTVALAACSGPDPVDEVEAPPAATTYSFAKADLHRAAPKDICRQSDPDFALRLMGRVDAALPEESRGSAQFDQFFVQDSGDGAGQKEAVLRFTARHNGQDGVMMFAIGPFASQGCVVGPMRASVGGDLFKDAGKHAFAIP
ncbi:MAG: hypothetical protein CVT74_05065 [Alphaproteobacteria bacterium HGW-Alphaproteobacteria-13]|nr:MAG: hypothetical protein CVT74_05065 [Alphaproteobacteria bacterium HGW-Alphaproteobacteria-13]